MHVFLGRGQQENFFQWRKLGLGTGILARSSNALTMPLFLIRLRWTAVLWITWGLLWCFISCLDSHSDGTHSLQWIHWWASNVMLNFSKSVLMKKWTHLHLGWPDVSQYEVNSSFKSVQTSKHNLYWLPHAASLMAKEKSIVWERMDCLFRQRSTVLSVKVLGCEDKQKTSCSVAMVIA